MHSPHKLKARLSNLDELVTVRRNVTLMLLGTLVAFLSVVIRFFTIQGIEGGGDAVYKWGVIRQIVTSHYFPTESPHHTLRWGINLPVYLVQIVFGDSPANYYIWPVISSSITAIFCFLLVERMTNWRWGLLSAISFITSWHAFRSGSQFLPMGPAVMFMVAALFFLFVYMQKGTSKNLVASAIMYFCSYGAKITAIYYLPAFLILIVLFAPRPNGKLRDCWKPVFFFCLIIVLFLIIETSLIYLVTGHLGRIAALNYGQSTEASIAAFHQGLGTAVHYFQEHPYSLPPYPEEVRWDAYSVSWWQYLWNFAIYVCIWKSGMVRFSIYVGAILSAIALVRGKRVLYLVSIPCLFGFFAHAYAIRGFDPMIRTEFALVRYWALLLLLSSLVVTLFVAVSYKASKTPWIKFSLATLAVSLVAWQAVDLLPHNWSWGAGIRTAWKNEQLIREAREKGQAVVVKALPSIWMERGPKVALRYRCVYGNDADLAAEMKWGSDPVVFDKETGIIKKFSDLAREGVAVADYPRYLVLMERNGNTDQELVRNYIEVRL